MSSYTQSESFTITGARHVTSRVASDMLQMMRHYGYPGSTQHIEDIAEELALLLHAGYLGTFEVGFKRPDGSRVLTEYYEARNGLLTDSRSGGIRAGVDISGANGFNFVEYSHAWWRLSLADRAAFKAKLPIDRTSGEGPTDGDGFWTEDRSYSAGGVGLQRRQFVPR